MLNGIQNQNINNIYEPLSLSQVPPGVNLSDPDLIPVFPVSPEFVGLNSIASGGPSKSINGASVTVEDIEQDTHLGVEPDALQQRYYQSVRINFSGGTVTPITTWVFYVFGVTQFGVFKFSAANPSTNFVGPFYVPAGAVLQIFNATVGGAGDVISLNLIGIQAKPSVPIPIIPSPSIHSTA